MLECLGSANWGGTAFHFTSKTFGGWGDRRGICFGSLCALSMF